jgi:hypothetical protein
MAAISDAAVGVNRLTFFIDDVQCKSLGPVLRVEDDIIPTRQPFNISANTTLLFLVGRHLQFALAISVCHAQFSLTSRLKSNAPG